MSILINILLVINVLVSLLIILLVLMQRPKNEGLGAAFGGGMTDNLFGAQTTNVLQTITRWLGAIFFVLALTLSWLYVKQSKQGGSQSAVQQKLSAPSVVPPAATPTPAPNPNGPGAIEKIPADGKNTPPEGASFPPSATSTPVELEATPAVPGAPAPAESAPITPAPTTGDAPAPPPTAASSPSPEARVPAADAKPVTPEPTAPEATPAPPQ